MSQPEIDAIRLELRRELIKLLRNAHAAAAALDPDIQFTESRVAILPGRIREKIHALIHEVLQA